MEKASRLQQFEALFGDSVGRRRYDVPPMFRTVSLNRTRRRKVTHCCPVKSMMWKGKIFISGGLLA